MVDIETVIGVLMAIIAVLVFYNYYYRKLLINMLFEDVKEKESISSYEFSIYFKKRKNETKKMATLRKRVNVSAILIFCNILLIIILAGLMM